MPAYPHIETYRDRLRELIEFGGSDNELNISPAFQGCLDAYCRDHRDKLVLVPQLPAQPGIIPDGTIKDSLRMARGYWEAKDSHDDLDAEIQRKFNRGYPRDNIVFEDSRTAVLFQNRQEAMRVDMARPRELHRLIRRFLDYELPSIAEFRKAQQQFKADLPTVLENLRAAVEDAAATNREYQAAAAAFQELCQRTIGPAVSAADVREMLLQHILTKDIFLRVFAEDQFHRENNIARQLDALEQTFFTGNVRRQAIDRLRAYYSVIGRSADAIADYAEKQQFLKGIYESFYQAYNPAAADYLGVVYTPNEVVDFIIRGTDGLLQKHFGRSLADNQVQILDPATGTGTFITSLINYLPPERLEYKYQHEIHANEVAILPYYIANLNIEYSYQERAGHYREFPNLCFVDTLDNLGWQEQGASGAAVQRQGAFSLGALSEENWLRLQGQNAKTISVILGNPPYNDSATLWGDGGDNRPYLEVDRRIRDTYIKEGTAQKTHQYDMYKRFLRWASDRLADDGIIGFITNRSYLDGLGDDGFRKVIREEFSDLYIVDLGGDIRSNRKVGNVFGIRTGVTIGFFVRQGQAREKAQIHYYALDDALAGAEKLAALTELNFPALDMEKIAPDARHNWLHQSASNFDQLLPLAGPAAKLESSDAAATVFGFYTPAIKSNRDGWVYDFDPANLRAKAAFFADAYNAFLAAGDDSYDPVIKWSDSLKDRFLRGETMVEKGPVIRTLWRPFVVQWHFAAKMMNDRLTGNHYELFGQDLNQPNSVINFRAKGKNFHVLATDKPADIHFATDTQCLPLYRYTAEGERVSNITDWGLQRFREHYRDESITAEDIFAYTYAVLHDPVYRYDYGADLLREFPRLPFYVHFGNWAEMGRELLALHLGFATAEPYPLERRESRAAAAKGGKAILKADKEQGLIRLDDQTTLAGVPAAAWRYTLGSRSALEWVLDQYKERKPRDPTIAARFNAYRFADHKESVIALLRRVCAVSVGTMEVVDGLAYWRDGQLVVSGDRQEYDLAMLGLAARFSQQPDSYDDPENQAWLGSLPDLREGA